MPDLTIADRRVPCRHWGELRKPKGLKLHESACPRNPDRRLPVAAAAPEPALAAAPEPTPEPARRRRRAAAPEPAPEPEPTPAAAPEPALITCEACGRAGTPSRSRPRRCVVCGISDESAAARIAALGPPRSPQSDNALAILERAGDPALRDLAFRSYLRARAADYQLTPEAR